RSASRAAAVCAWWRWWASRLDLPDLDGVPIIDLPAGVSEGRERLILGIINEDIPVCHVENSESSQVVSSNDNVMKK
ncbi:MAG: hypothetical protein PHS80_12970, partial [Methanothrix sp.]|nr:hypothetical protein [Methanothrix sp.]